MCSPTATPSVEWKGNRARQCGPGTQMTSDVFVFKTRDTNGPAVAWFEKHTHLVAAQNLPQYLAQFTKRFATGSHSSLTSTTSTSL
ncbi:unnamed protein product [Rhizoctonia solani]|uniref:Uncharacterized protein n=1 Tax=Rhizoctonia solani TaxID=456999 RepID=A0A8H2XHI5_9AGAM|nr:unnamed protein product [Rhizoctonia solani]